MAYKYIPYDGPIVTRAYAIEHGLKTFFIEKKCRHGHLSERNVSKSDCMACLKIRQAKWYAVNRDMCIKRNLLWRTNNSEQFLLKKKQHRQANPEKYAEYKKKWFDENKEKAYETLRNCDARRRGAKGVHNKEDISKIGKAQNWKCLNCGKCIKKKYHVDHVMPIALGGTNWSENLALLCPSCNLRKSAKHPDDWARENGRLF